MATASGFAERYTPPNTLGPQAVQAKLKRLRWLVNILDTAVTLPGGFKFGADTFIGLTPVAGDIATALIACYFVYEGRRLGLPRRALVKMGGNVVLDLLLGAVPVAGDLADTWFKANVRNLAIIEKYLA